MLANIKFWNQLLSYILKKKRRNSFSGALSFLIGAHRKTRSLRSIHSLYFSVSKSFPPILSFSVLKFVTTTPMKRLRKKKKPMIMKNIKKIVQKIERSALATKSISVEVRLLSITSVQPAVVDMTNKVIIALGMLSKL
jgi:hypothetical protein